jgi:hypothetical protein
MAPMASKGNYAINAINNTKNNMENTLLLSHSHSLHLISTAIFPSLPPPEGKFEIKFMIIGLHRCIAHTTE